MSRAFASRVTGSVENYLRQAMAVADSDVRKLFHDPVELFTRMVQPTLWLVIFGQVLNRSRAIPTGRISYLEFLCPGVLAQSVLIGAIFYGISLIWERDLGIVQKFLVSPAPRSALVLGRALSSTVRGLCQMVFIYLLAIILRLHMHLGIANLLGMALAVALGAAVFSTFSLAVACLVKSRERFMGIGQVLTIPLFFASNAIYPIALMPPWLGLLSRANPLCYQVDALRALMMAGGESTFGVAYDFVMLAIAFGVSLVIGSKLYPNIVT